MKIAKVDRLAVEDGRAVILSKVEKYEDISFGHIVMAESVLKALNLDDSIVMDAVISLRGKK